MSKPAASISERVGKLSKASKFSPEFYQNEISLFFDIN